MKGISISFLAACFSATGNLFFRRSSEKSKEQTYNYYLLFFYFTSFVVSLLLFPSEKVSFNAVMFGVGCLVGVMNVLMMGLTSQALLTGPTGLTFAFQNASSIFPGIILFALFGPKFGFEITLFQIFGMSLVVLGLFLGSMNNQQKHPLSAKWMMYAFGCFLTQMCALSIIHWRCLLFTNNVPHHALIPWSVPECADSWFLPGQFGVALLLQLGRVLLQERRMCVLPEVFYGTLGGVANAIGSFALLISTQVALPQEKGLIFPCFAATAMILCNVWANKLYREPFNVKANSFCASGILLGSLRV